ncbi:MAG: alanine dehydrogenase [Nitrospirae bacterium]|nr:MAG: alanine dehydrogenase [Nitrospirota bacterium]
MVIGIPKEIKDHEFRVALTPMGVAELTSRGHEVWIEAAAGQKSGFSDEEYRQAGAHVTESKAQVFDQAELIIKVKEPLLEECALLQARHTLFTFLHLAASKTLTEALLARGLTALAYETTEDAQGRLPILYPMSTIAGRMAVQIGAHFLEQAQGGRGVLLGGVPGVEAGHVVILGAGNVGSAATHIAVGMGAQVTVLSIDLDQLRSLEEQYQNRIRTLMAHQQWIAAAVEQADLLIGAVMVRGGRTPTLVSRALVSRMKPGSVIVDVAVDQGGCVETIHPTTHSAPVYRLYEVLHYGVTNIPGVVPRTATYALTNATLPFIVQLAEAGVDQAIRLNAGLARGVNVRQGNVTCRAVAETHGFAYVPPV